MHSIAISNNNVKEFSKILANNLFPVGINQGWWEYRDINNNHLGFTVRTLVEGRKQIRPWCYVDGQWVSKGFLSNDCKPIYNAQWLNIHCDKPILIVEGEKTADAGTNLFPQYITITWLGGAAVVKKANWEYLAGRIVYLLPDRDEPGYLAMLALKDILRPIAAKVYFVDIQTLPLPEGWDIADLENGEVDIVDIKQLFVEAVNKAQEPQLICSDLWPDKSINNKPLNTSANIKLLLDFYNKKVKYNLVTNRIEINDSTLKFSATNEYDCHRTVIAELCIKNYVPKVDLDDYLLLLADQNRYSPVIDFIESKPWDKISRINDFLSTVTSSNQPLANILMHKWLLGAVAAAYSTTGISLPGVLVFQGNQGIGKTAWFNRLLPKSHQHLLKEGLTLDPNNKDSVIGCTTIWLGELGELDATFSKSAISYLKSFITRSIDYYRPHYGRHEKQFPRTTAFYGSVNNTNYLIDETGNRRWWTIAVTKIDYLHNIDMQQVWAEYKNLLDNGESYLLDQQQNILLNNENELFQEIDPMEDMILKRFNWDNNTSTNPMTSSEVLQAIGFILTDANTRKNAMRCSSILTKLTGSNARKSHGKKVFDVPKWKVQVESLI